jgi:protein TonB
MMKYKMILAALVMGCVSSVSYAGTATIDTKAPCAKPEYPKASLMNEEQGVVSISLLVGTDGVVSESKVEKSSGSKGLDKAALKALSACKFKPASGKSEWQNIEYAWKLD